MAAPIAHIEVIFQVYNAPNWMDYCRERSPHTEINPTNNWAKDHCQRLQKQINAPFRFYLEDWS